MPGTGRNILVTGGGGYIGSHCILQLLQEDFNVIAVDNFVNSIKGMQICVIFLTASSALTVLRLWKFVKSQKTNLLATSEPPKYSNSNSPNLCFDFFNDFATNNLRRIRKEYLIRL